MTLGAGVGIIFNLTNDWDQTQSFGMIAAITAFFGAVIMFWITEPLTPTPLDEAVKMAAQDEKDQEKKKEKEGEKKSKKMANDDDFEKASVSEDPELKNTKLTRVTKKVRVFGKSKVGKTSFIKQALGRPTDILIREGKVYEKAYEVEIAGIKENLVL